MPMKNYHSVRLQSPGKYDDWSYTTGGFLYGKSKIVPSNASIVWGHPKGKPTKTWIPQALRFPKKGYTLAEVKTWLKKNKIKFISVEAAAKSKVGVQTRIARELLLYGEEIKPMLATEAFVSLRAALEKAVSYRFGKDAFTHDFSTKEVIIGYSSSNARPLSSWESGEYEKTSYKIDGKGKVTFIGPITKVTKKVTFEDRSADDWKALWDVEYKLSVEAEKASAICRSCSTALRTVDIATS